MVNALPSARIFRPRIDGVAIEFSLPKTLADDEDIIVAGFAFLCAKGAAANRLDAEQWEKIGRNNCACDSFRRTSFGKIVGRIIKGSEFVEAAHLLLVIDKFGRRDRDVVEMLIFEMLKQQNQLLRFLYGNGRMRSALTSVKTAVVAPIPKSERNNRDESERGILDQNSKSEAKFVQHKISARHSCWSLVTKRVDRIEMRGGTRREIARRHANHEQDERQNGEAERVVRGNLREIVP